MGSQGHRSDPTLVAGCLRGEPRCWEELVDRYGRLVYSIARRYGVGEGDAEDIQQTVFLILFRRLETLTDQTRLSAWLITTTHRECWRHRRRPARQMAEPDDLVADVSSPREEELEAWEEQHLVRLGLERLGGRCEALLRALFRDRGVSSYETIAAELGIKVGSIGPSRARCFAKLEPILIELGLGPRADRKKAPDGVSG